MWLLVHTYSQYSKVRPGYTRCNAISLPFLIFDSFLSQAAAVSDLNYCETFLTLFYNQTGSRKCLHTGFLFTAGVMNRSWIIQAVAASGNFKGPHFTHISAFCEFIFHCISPWDSASVPHYLFTFQIAEDLAKHTVFRYRQQINQPNNLWKSDFDAIWYQCEVHNIAFSSESQCHVN